MCSPLRINVGPRVEHGNRICQPDTHHDSARNGQRFACASSTSLIHANVPGRTQVQANRGFQDKMFKMYTGQTLKQVGVNSPPSSMLHMSIEGRKFFSGHTCSTVDV